MGKNQNNKALKKPTYEQANLSAGIVHIGVGNFHRAHQAWYLHRLMQMGLNYDFAIIGAGVRSYDEQMRQKLKAQNYLTTLIELGPNEQSAEEIGSMIDYVPIEINNQSLIKQMSDEAIRIVSLTVTEGGYYLDPATKKFANNHPDMIFDSTHPDTPKTAFGAMIAALKIRKEKAMQPFTCQSCDNLQGNGDILKQTVLSLAQLSDPKLANWIEKNGAFPNSMVDCIVPATGDKELAIAKTMGLENKNIVTHENFRQWVIEDNFCNGRPNWEKVGATLTPDVHNYEKMKIRILNGGHQIIAATGDLLGIKTISETINHPLINAFFYKVQIEEIMPNVEAVKEYTVNEYIKLVAKRFSNPAIVDTTRRVAFDGSARQTGFILPSVYDNLKANRKTDGLALTSAIWARYCLGIREDESKIEANDPYWNDLVVRAKKAQTNPKVWLENQTLYGDLVFQKSFCNNFEKWLNLIYQKGMLETLQTYNQS